MVEMDGGDGWWRWMVELVAWMPEILGCRDAGGAKCWRCWVLEVLSTGRRNAGCCFIIV